jgi:transposase InsO family protein
MEVPSLGGRRYFSLFIDDATRWTEVEILTKKSEALEVFKVFKAKVEKKHRRSIKALRADGGDEYTSKEFAAFLQENGIEKETTAPYTPQENGVSERANRTIFGRAHCMLFDAGLAKKFWAEAVLLEWD